MRKYLEGSRSAATRRRAWSCKLQHKHASYDAAKGNHNQRRGQIQPAFGRMIRLLMHRPIPAVLSQRQTTAKPPTSSNTTACPRVSLRGIDQISDKPASLRMCLSAYERDLSSELHVTQRPKDEDDRRYDVKGGHVCLPPAKVSACQRKEMLKANIIRGQR